MKFLLTTASFALLLFTTSCSSGPAFADKINKEAYQRIELGSSYEQVLMQVGGLEPRKLTENLLKWQDDVDDPTFVISVGIKDGKVSSKHCYRLVDGQKKDELQEP